VETGLTATSNDKDAPKNKSLFGGQQSDLAGVLLDGRYRLLEPLAEGGMGTVWRARHELMRREVAVKILPTSLQKVSKHVESFKREIDTICELDHPNIVELYDAGFDARVGHYAAMRMLKGKDLATRITSGPALTILEILSIAEQTGRALDACHNRQIIHRDVKPENVFLGEDPQSPSGWSVRMLDFGVSMFVEQAASRAGGGKPNSVAGTPYTMSPEQIRGRRLDARTDIYSFGILLFELFTGRYPFNPNSVNELLRMQVLVVAPHADAVEGGEWLPAEIVDLLASMLEKDRANRPASMRDVLLELEAARPAVTSAWAATFMGRERRQGAPLRSTSGNHDRFRTLQLLDTDAVITNDNITPMPTPPKRKKPVRGARQRRKSGASIIGISNPNAFRVVIVDDEAAIRMLLQMVCDRAGCAHKSFENGESLLAAHDQSDPPDAVILDLLMPGIDGLETLTKLRNLNYTGPVIVCSTLESGTVRDRIAGFTDVVFMDKVIEFNRMHDLLVHWSNIKSKEGK
jgi:serine/threonine protein kinase